MHLTVTEVMTLSLAEHSQWLYLAELAMTGFAVAPIMTLYLVMMAMTGLKEIRAEILLMVTYLAQPELRCLSLEMIF